MALDSIGWLAGASGLLQMFGALETGKSARIAGEMAKARSEFEAQEAERQAGISQAIAQRHALEEQRKARLVASRALAVAAASGGGVSDPTVIRLIAAAEGEGSYRAQVALYEGEEKARTLRLQAAASRVAGAEAVVQGRSTETGYMLAGFGALAKSGATLYARYGMKSPTPAGKGDSALLQDNAWDLWQPGGAPNG